MRDNSDDNRKWELEKCNVDNKRKREKCDNPDIHEKELLTIMQKG